MNTNKVSSENGSLRKALIVVTIVSLVAGIQWGNVAFILPNAVTDAKIEASKEHDSLLIEKAKKQWQRDMLEFAIIKPHLSNIESIVSEEHNSSPEESIRMLVDLVDFGIKRKREHKVWLDKYQPFLDAEIEKRGREADYNSCGYVLADKLTGEPQYFVTCHFGIRTVFIGRPRERLVRDVYYWKTPEGKAVIISWIYPVISALD